MKNRTKTPRRVALPSSFLEQLENRLHFSRLTGNDVSQFQGTMNWTTNYNTGNRFALIRGSRSDTLPDTQAATNVPGAKAAGLIVGVYHRALPLGLNNAGSFRDPVVDADSFISTSGQWMTTGYIRPVLDMEDGETLTMAANGYTPATWAVAWINRIKAIKGVTPIVYTGSSYASTYLNSSVVAAAPDVWIANWTETTYGDPVNGSGNPPQGPWGSGSSWDFWQYGGGSGGWGPFYGAGGNSEIDRDVFNGSTVDTLKLNYVLGCAATPSGPSPANNATNFNGAAGQIINWADSTNATRYDLYIDGALNAARTNLSVSQYTLPSNLSVGAHTWQVVAKGSQSDDDTWITGPVWNFSSIVNSDITPPTATLGGQTPTTGATTFTFTVTYADSGSGIDYTTLDSNDITVTGPNSYSDTATFISVDNSSNGTPRVATYRIPAPGGNWTDFDNGAYTITQVASQVKDVVGNARAAGTIGTFNISNLGTAWMGAFSSLFVGFDGSAVPVQLSTNGTAVRVTKNGNILDFSTVNSITVQGSSTDDRLQINAPLAKPMNFSATTGNDLVEVLAGSFTFTADIAATNRNIAVYVASGATATFNSTQHLRSLSVDGTANFAANGTRVLWVTDLAITGKLNLADNDLIWDYTAGTPIGAWAGSAYNGLTGLITQARGSGSWNGNGLATDQAAAVGTTPLTNLAIAEASDVLTYTGSTALFDSQTVDSTAVLVKYTYTADADLNGAVTGDDYFRIDSAWPSASPSYLHGDFDLNGKLDADDYFLIDSTYSHQGVFL